MSNKKQTIIDNQNNYIISDEIKKEIMKLLEENNAIKITKILYENILSKMEPIKIIKGPEDVLYLNAKYAFKDKEYALLLTLDNKNSIINEHIISIGTQISTPMDPKEIYKVALKDNAVSIILSHNHPSGNIMASPDDMKVTQKIKDAGDLINIKLLDHIILAYNERENKILGNSIVHGEQMEIKIENILENKGRNNIEINI